MAGNASKANFKRIYFKRKGLDITSRAEYKKGMEEFQDELDENQELYFSLAEKLGYYIQIEIYLENGFCTDHYNVPLLPMEQERIKDKFLQARHFENIEEVMTQVFDSSEGAGFGIILMILMLRKMGLDERVIQFFSNGKKTRFQLRVPLHLIGEMEQKVITEAIVKEVEVIPQFLQHILALQKILALSCRRPVL